MGIEIKDSGFVVNCDFCLNNIEVKSEYISDVVKALNEEGWKYYKNIMENDAWNYDCPDCQEEANDNPA